MAKISGQHALGDPAEVATQLPMSMSLLVEGKQDFGCPSADKY
jgi:hypothetical protein